MARFQSKSLELASIRGCSTRMKFRVNAQVDGGHPAWRYREISDQFLPDRFGVSDDCRRSVQ